MVNSENMKEDILEIQDKYNDEISGTKLETILRLALTAALDPDDEDMLELVKMRVEQEKSDLKVIALEKLEKKGYDLFTKIILQLGLTL